MLVLSSAEDLKKRECMKSLKELFSMTPPPTSTELQRSYSDMVAHEEEMEVIL